MVLRQISDLFFQTRRKSWDFFYRRENQSMKRRKAERIVKKEAKKERGNDLIIRRLSTHASLESILLKYTLRIVTNYAAIWTTATSGYPISLCRCSPSG